VLLERAALQEMPELTLQVMLDLELLETPVLEALQALAARLALLEMLVLVLLAREMLMLMPLPLATPTRGSFSTLMAAALTPTTTLSLVAAATQPLTAVRVPLRLLRSFDRPSRVTYQEQA
jgi:hypothetical protein